MEENNGNPPAGNQPASNEQIDRDVRMWAMFCHLAGLAGYVIPVIVSGIIAPLIIWQIKKEDDPFIDESGKEALNFQISIAIYSAICIPFVFILIGIPMLIAVGIFNVVFLIIAALKANNGENFRYPMSIRFIK